VVVLVFSCRRSGPRDRLTIRAYYLYLLFMKRSVALICYSVRGLMVSLSMSIIR
jgi:hypothetical protein